MKIKVYFNALTEAEIEVSDKFAILTEECNIRLENELEKTVTKTLGISRDSLCGIWTGDEVLLEY